MATKTFVASWDAVTGAVNYKVLWVVNGAQVGGVSTISGLTTQNTPSVNDGDIVAVEVQACNNTGCSVGTVASITASVEAIPESPVVTIVQQ